MYLVNQAAGYFNAVFWNFICSMQYDFGTSLCSVCTMSFLCYSDSCLCFWTMLLSTCFWSLFKVGFALTQYREESSYFPCSRQGESLLFSFFVNFGCYSGDEKKEVWITYSFLPFLCLHGKPPWGFFYEQEWWSVGWKSHAKWKEGKELLTWRECFGP